MRINFLYEGALVVATLCVAPAALPASPGASQPGVGTAGSSEGAFANDASSLLQHIQVDALRVENDADRLQMFMREPTLIDWQVEGDLLNGVRARVNAIDKLLHQLRVNQAGALRWQQQAIERITPSVVNLTDTTQQAIISLNDNQGHIYSSDLGGLAADMYKQARLIDQAILNFEKYATARHEAQQLRQTLGLKNNS